MIADMVHTQDMTFANHSKITYFGLISLILRCLDNIKLRMRWKSWKSNLITERKKKLIVDLIFKELF